MCFVDSVTSPAIVLLKSWMLYEKPGFLGRTIALEEGPTDHLVNMWADPRGQPIPTAPMVIGSIRLVVRVSECTCFLFFCSWSCSLLSPGPQKVLQILKNVIFFFL